MKLKDLLILRPRLCILIGIILLTGCVRYSGIHSESKPVNDPMFKTTYHETHTAPRLAAIKKADWWKQFKDPTLNQLVAGALAESPSIQIAQSRVRQAQQEAEAAGAALWPSADGYAQIARERITRNGIFPPPYGGNSYTETNIGASFKYDFDFFGQNKQFLQASISSAQAAEADYAEARLILSTAVSTTYFQLQSYLSLLAIENAILQHDQELLNIIKTLARHGIDSDIPVSSSLADMEAVKINVAKLKAEINISEHQLAALTGRNPFTTHIRATRLGYNKLVFAMPTVIPANLLGQRPDLIASRWRMEAAAHQVNAYKAKFYPNVNLAGFVSLQSYVLNKTFILPSRDMLIGPAIDLPIFDAGKRRADLSQKYAEYDNAVGMYNNTILTGLQQVADETAKLNSINAQQTAQIAELNATKRNFDLVRSRYQHGIVNYSRVLMIENTFLKRQYEQIQLQTRHLNSMVTLMKALGGSYLTVEA